MTNPIIDKFLKSDLDNQFRMLDDAATADAVRSWIGADAFSEFVKYRAAAHLAAGPRNLVFVPGVMGSTLQSEGLGGVWWLDLLRARDMVDRLALTPDGKNDLDAEAQIVPGTVDVTYVPFRSAVAVSGNFGGSVQFPYDWRKPLAASAAALREVIVKCNADYGEPVHLVGHSMGGLMIRTTLMLHGKELWPLLGKIVFIGTPHYGAGAIAGYLKNHLWGWEEMAVLGLFLSRETFRSMRGVLSLLPAPPGTYPGTRNGEPHPCANFDMYNAEAWKLGLDAAGTVQLQNVLDEVAQYCRDLSNAHQKMLQDSKDRMLMIAGVGYKTMFRLEYDTRFFGMWEHAKKITDRIPGDPNRDGDSRVPLASAQLEDVTLRYVKGVHGGLPNIPAVARDVLAWLKNRPLSLPQTPEEALGAHLSADDTDSAAPHLDGSAEFDRYREIPEDQVRELAKGLDKGALPNINLTRIL